MAPKKKTEKDKERVLDLSGINQDWRPSRLDTVERLTREILLRKLEFKGGRTYAEDVDDAKVIAEHFADVFGYE